VRRNTESLAVDDLSGGKPLGRRAQALRAQHLNGSTPPVDPGEGERERCRRDIALPAPLPHTARSGMGRAELSLTRGGHSDAASRPGFVRTPRPAGCTSAAPGSLAWARDVRAAKRKEVNDRRRQRYHAKRQAMSGGAL